MDDYINNLISNLISNKDEETLREKYQRCWQVLGVLCVEKANSEPTFETIYHAMEARNNLFNEMMDIEQKLATNLVVEDWKDATEK